MATAENLGVRETGRGRLVGLTDGAVDGAG